MKRSCKSTFRHLRWGVIGNMKRNTLLSRLSSCFTVHLGFFIPTIFGLFVNPDLFSEGNITGYNFPRTVLAFSCILGACLLSIGCLRYKRRDKGILPDYAGFGLYLFIGSFLGLYLLISRFTTYY